MLDRSKVVKALQEKSTHLFFDTSQEQHQAQAVWHKVCNDPLALPLVQAHPQLHLAQWYGQLQTTTPVTPITTPYNIVAVDGSQIYPDKHQGTQCFLINIGSVSLSYQPITSHSTFDSEPFIFVDQDFGLESPTLLDIVNGKREEFELSIGLEKTVALAQKVPHCPTLFMFDGSLIFWHLEHKDALLKHYFMNAYNTLLLEFYKQNIPVVGYISLSKSKDLINLIRAYSHMFSKIDTNLFAHLVDAHILSDFLQPGSVSTVFASQSLNVQDYPEQVQPHFLYYHAGTEYVRLEFPRYVAEDKTMLTTVLGVVADQVAKGYGYPIATAEAHHQAVVQGPDRDFFYYMIEIFGITTNHFLKPSEKALKKRKMAV